MQFIEFTVPNMLPAQYRQFFRIQPTTVNKLILFLTPSVHLQGLGRNKKKIPVWKKVYMTLAYLGTQATTLKYTGFFLHLNLLHMNRTFSETLHV